METAAIAAARQEGREAAASHTLPPNPYHWQDPRCEAWFAGYAERRAEGQPKLAIPAPVPDNKALPGVQTVLTVDSPGYTLRRPSVINADAMTAPARAAMEAAWAQPAVEKQTIRVLLVEDASVVGDGLVFNRDGEVVPATAHGFSSAEIEAARVELASAVAEGRIKTHLPLHVLCKNRVTARYNGYVLEGLTRAALAVSVFPPGLLDQELHYVVDQPATAMLDAIYRSLQHIGISPLHVLPTGGEPRRYRTLFVLDGVAVPGVSLAAVAVRRLEMLALSVPVTARRQWFVRPAAGRLNNEAAVVAHLAARGFGVLDVASMPFLDQVAAFRGADAVIGMAGSNLANIAFCRAGVRVTVLAPPDLADPTLWFAACCKGLRYQEIRGVAGGGGTGFTISPGDLDKAIESG